MTAMDCHWPLEKAGEVSCDFKGDAKGVVMGDTKSTVEVVELSLVVLTIAMRSLQMLS